MRFGLPTLLLTLLAPTLVMAEQEKVRLNGDTELRAAVSHLQESLDNGLDPHKATYLRYFTTYAVPQKLQADCVGALQFALNSTAHFRRSDGNLYHAKQVPDHPTLWYIDIRDFGWDIRQWEVVSDLEPYFKEPLVDSKVYNYGRLISGNLLFRADWFAVAATDVTQQDDRGEKRILYYILLYGEGNEPKNGDDFEKAWRVDKKTIKIEQLERGTIVDAGDSGVSQHTRQLRRARTVYGYFWETRDVKSHDIDPENQKSRDFIEDIFANQFDAGEYISSHKNGLQVYFLTAGVKDKEKRVEFGDPTIVVDRSDPHDPRVRTGKSCIVCHPLGINPATNAIAEVFQAGGKLYARYDDLKRQIEAFYLDKRFNSLIEQDNKIYEDAVKECNGLDPIRNTQAYVNIYEWYTAKVTPEQAAFELGMDTEMLKAEIKAGVTGRLVRLYYGKSVPRDVWDSVNAGCYTQAVLLVKRIKVVAKPADPAAKPKSQPQQAMQLEVTSDWAEVWNGKEFVVYLPKGTKTLIKEVNGDWYYIEYQGKQKSYQGYIHRKDVKVTVK